MKSYKVKMEVEGSSAQILSLMQYAENLGLDVDSTVPELIE